MQLVYVELRYQQADWGAVGVVSLLGTAKSLERDQSYSFIFVGR